MTPHQLAAIERMRQQMHEEALEVRSREVGLTACATCGAPFPPKSTAAFCPPCLAARWSRRERVPRVKPVRHCACGEVLTGPAQQKWCPECAAERRAERERVRSVESPRAERAA
jgi:rubrerythrin